MNKEQYNKLFINKTAELIEWRYSVSQGKIGINSYPKTIKYKDDEHFNTTSFGYDISFDEIQRWIMSGWSSNSYSYRIFLLKDESVDKYIDEINEYILRGLRKEIEELKASVNAIENYRRIDDEAVQ